MNNFSIPATAYSSTEQQVLEERRTKLKEFDSSLVEITNREFLYNRTIYKGIFKGENPSNYVDEIGCCCDSTMCSFGASITFDGNRFTCSVAGCD